MEKAHLFTESTDIQHAAPTPYLTLTHGQTDARHEKTDLKVFVVVIPKEGWASLATPILLLV